VSMNERAAGLLTRSHPHHWAGFSVVGACGGASGCMYRNRGMQDQATQQRSRASSHVAPLLVLLPLTLLAAARLAAAELEAPGFDMVEHPEALTEQSKLALEELPEDLRCFISKSTHRKGQ
jgi:hypothetical protein